jgi:hypothetical protein
VHSWHRHKTRYNVFMYRTLAIAVLFAAAVSASRLEGQTRAMQRPSAPTRMSVGPRLRVVRPAPSGFGAMSPRSFTRQALPVGRVPVHHQLCSHIFSSSSWLSEREAIGEEGPRFEERGELPSEERAEELTEELIGESVFLPYSVYAATPYYQVAEQTPAYLAQRNSDLAREIDQLRDEVERLREEQASREQARQAALQPRPPVEEKTPTTILVFRDGRRSEIQNYAIVGQTLWVFTERRAHKMPVADLDLEATKNVNDDRDVEFRLP